MRNAAAAFIMLAFAFNAVAQSEGEHDHHSMSMNSAPSSSDNAPTREYKQAMQRMHEGMDITYTGDPDKDFAAGMIPHHQGAIDMAYTQLKYGKDPALKRLAKSIIVAQKKEIRFMQDWYQGKVSGQDLHK